MPADSPRFPTLRDGAAIHSPPPPPLAMGWANFDGTPTIYITSDPGLNQVSLTFTNQLGGPVTLAPGKPAALGSLPANESAIYLWIAGLITNAEIADIQVGPSGWSVQSFTGADPDPALAYLVLASSSKVSLPAGQTLTLELTNVTATSSDLGQGYVSANFANATGISWSITLQVEVIVENPPVVGALDLLVGFAGSNVVLTGQANALTLYLTNPNPTPLVPGGPAAWGPVPPTFQLSFGFGSGVLAPPSDGSPVTVSVANDFGNAWQVVQQQQGALPVWILQPTAESSAVLGTGAGASIELSLTGLVGSAAGVACAYLACSNLPGYDDGFYALEIVVAAPIDIPLFTATPSSVANATGGTGVVLEWVVVNATSVTVVNAESVDIPWEQYVEAGEVAVTVYATTCFTLIACNAATGQQLSASVTVTVEPDLFHLMPTNTILMFSGSQPPPGWEICSGNGTPAMGPLQVTNGSGQQYGVSFILKNT